MIISVKMRKDICQTKSDKNNKENWKLQKFYNQNIWQNKI